MLIYYSRQDTEKKKQNRNKISTQKFKISFPLLCKNKNVNIDTVPPHMLAVLKNKIQTMKTTHTHTIIEKGTHCI